MEDLDALAADVAYRHMRGPGAAESNATLVTAAMDRMEWAAGFRLDHDLHVSGVVSWVGKSSMEVPKP